MTAFAVSGLWVAGLAVLFAGAVSDIRHRIVPNRVVALTAGIGVALRLILDPHWLGISVAASAVLLLVFGCLAHLQVIGGGDAKLLAAVALMVSPADIPALYLAIAVGGGIISCAYLVAHLASRRRSFSRVRGRASMALSHREGLRRTEILNIAERRTIPYGLAIFTGTAIAGLCEATRWCYATS